MFMFSVLISIYYKEKAEYLNKCFESIWDKQTIKPNEIILVEDGKLTEELYFCITNLKKKLGSILKVISLRNNSGLGKALQIGLYNCNFNIIARMDTDDISYPRRFEKQLEVFKKNNIDICSGWVAEFKDNQENIISYRKLPEFHEKIVKYAKLRSPINHPAVMFKKDSVLKAGGYREMLWFEDYYLWCRMINQGAKFHNIQEPLVKMRIGNGLISRRSGIKYAIAEYYFQKKLYNMGFINHTEFIRNISLRFILRILPTSFLKNIYRIIRKL